MSKRDRFEFTVTMHATRYTANKMLQQFIDAMENDFEKRSMRGERIPDMSVSVSTLRKCAPNLPEGEK